MKMTRLSPAKFAAGSIAFCAVLGILAAYQSMTRPRERNASGEQRAVPAQYQDLYSTLKASLDGYTRYLDSRHKSEDYPVTFGAEVLVANANRGPALLKPQAIKGAVLELERFKALGVQGATVAISYPLYTPDFPGYRGYVSYYRRVAEEVRKRGMKLDVEAGPVFPNPALQVSYADLTWDKYKSAKKQMVQAIINDLHPDYLNIGSEPDNDAKLLGLQQLNSPAGYTSYVRHVLDGLQRGSSKIGAGIGTWGNIEFVKSFAANTSLDNINLHFYPVSERAIQTAVEAAELAHRYNKGVVMDEIWLFKMGASDRIPSIAANNEIFKRDVFGFWAPLDQRYLLAMARLARQERVDYISPFWTNYLFAYIDYEGENHYGASYEELRDKANRAFLQNIVNGNFSSTGEFYGQMIRGAAR